MKPEKGSLEKEKHLHIANFEVLCWFSGGINPCHCDELTERLSHKSSHRWGSVETTGLFQHPYVAKGA